MLSNGRSEIALVSKGDMIAVDVELFTPAAHPWRSTDVIVDGGRVWRRHRFNPWPLNDAMVLYV
jgi:hypothetical protein